MSDLLQQLSSFLNLSKLVAVTVPGMIATLALVLFFIPPACKRDSQTCWYCMGEDIRGGTSEPKAGAARPQGTYLVSKLAWEQANQSYTTVSEFATTNLSACAQLPEYIVSSSRLKSEKETVKNLGDLVAIDPGSVLEDLDRCNSALTTAQTELDTKEAAQSNLIATLNANITKLNTALAEAKAAVNSALERSLAGKAKDTRKDLEAATHADLGLKSAVNAVGNLITQVSDSRKDILSDTSTAIPVETPTKTTWPAAMQGLGSQILIFLLVSIVVGQLLDPLQRAMVSIDPIRGWTFRHLNNLYRDGSLAGTVRFGDLHYRGARRKEFKPLLEKEPQLLEPSYAIGKGLLTQAEYNALQDQYYTQSQISTGLTVPLLLLWLAINFRLCCCGIVKFGRSDAFWYALGALVILLILLLLARRYLENAEERRRRLVIRVIRSLASLSLIAALVVVLAYVSQGGWTLVGLAVIWLALELLCFFAGSERLHKFYSEVQARIMGAAKKQQESQIKKFADILTDPKPKQSFVEELEKRDKKINQVLGPLTGEVSQVEKAIDLLTDPTLKNAFTEELRKRRKEIDDLLRPLGG